MVYARYSNPNLDISTKLMKLSTENYNNTYVSICNTAFIFESMHDTNPKPNMFCGGELDILSHSTCNHSRYWRIRYRWQQLVFCRYHPLFGFSYIIEIASRIASSTLVAASSSSVPRGEIPKAWMVGIAVGPVIGLVLIIVAILIFLSHRKKKRDLASQQG
jgi:hypothetical protein